MKKTLLSATLVALAGLSIAQDTILGTYLPVVNTEIKQVWIHSNVQGVATVNSMPLPTDGLIQGNEYFWDYSSLPMPNSSNTFSLKTYHPDSSIVQNTIGSHLSNFLQPSTGEMIQVSHWNSPIYSFSDVWTVSLVNDSGMYSVGHVNSSFAPYMADIKVKDLDNNNGKELVIPSIVDMYSHGLKYDSTILVSLVPGTSFGVNGLVTAIRYQYKKLEIIGWGSMKTPIDSVGGVLLGRELVKDSLLIYNNNQGDTTGGILNPPTGTVSAMYRYYFLRNNTFATSLLMQFNTNGDLVNPTISYAWYTLPSKVGSIEGTVYDSLNSNTIVTAGEALLYREHSNFTRDDILARATINPQTGVYHFDNIPYGDYRIAIRADSTVPAYSRMFTTYYEEVPGSQDAIDWLQADLVHTFSDTTGIDIYMRHDTIAPYQAQAVPNQLRGDVFRYEGGLKQGGNDPIEGIDIIVKKNPNEEPIISTTTDENGVYVINNLPDGSYKLWVDVPGLGMQSTYSFDVINGVYNRCEYDFDLGRDSIFREDYNTTQNGECFTGLKEIEEQVLAPIDVYPNPFSESVTIRLEIEKETNVSLEIYDITGKLVLHIAEPNLAKGIKVYEINAIQNAGIYILKAKIGNKTKTARIVKL